LDTLPWMNRRANSTKQTIWTFWLLIFWLGKFTLNIKKMIWMNECCLNDFKEAIRSAFIREKLHLISFAKFNYSRQTENFNVY
jgi:hypothetical protein